MLGDQIRRSLRGQPSLRRQLRNVDGERLQQAMSSLEGLDGRRWKDLYRTQLRRFAESEQAAAPNRRKEELEQAQREALQGGNQQEYSRLGSLIRTSTPRWGSVEQRNDPNRYGSAASRMFPGLYRG